jgi:hypothetical protein
MVVRVYIDTEFTDFLNPVLIGLALVADNGDEFYGECTDFDRSRCSDFVREIVLPQLGSHAGRAMSHAQLRAEVTDWLLHVPVRGRPILCYDNDVDPRLLEGLIGKPLPKGWQAENIWTRLDSARLEAFFAEHGHQHHALWDARANLACFQSKMDQRWGVA